MSESTPETPPTQPGQEQEAVETPPIVHEPAAAPPTPRAGKTIEVTRVPAPTVIGKMVIFPRVNGVDYTVGDKVMTTSQQLRASGMKVKAVARDGYKFAKGTKATFNL